MTADPIEPTWIAVAEVWSTRDDLDTYRNSGSDSDEADDPFRYIQEFHVQEYETV